MLTEEVCRRWLTYAAEVYGGIFPYYGTTDGGWAEGVFYAASYTKWYLPFFSAVERYTGKSYLSRPFYRNLAKFFVHFADPNRENHPFCDGYWCHPEDAEWPGFFAQNPYRFYAERFGDDEALRLMHALDRQEYFKLHLLDAFLPRGKRISETTPTSFSSMSSPQTELRQEAVPSCDRGYVPLSTPSPFVNFRRRDSAF